MQECLKDCSRGNRSDDQSYYHTYRRSNKIAEVNMVVFTSVLSEKIENIKSSIFGKKTNFSGFYIITSRLLIIKNI